MTDLEKAYIKKFVNDPKYIDTHISILIDEIQKKFPQLTDRIEIHQYIIVALIAPND